MRGRIVVNQRSARLGQTLRLLGAEFTATDIEVTAGPKVDPFLPAGFGQPSPGKRQVAVWLQLRNVGTARYTDALTRGAKLVTAANTRLAATPTRACADTVDVPAGQTRVGCVVFDLPYGASARGLEFRANFGLGRETGTWRLP